MNKTELIGLVAKRASMSKAKVCLVFEELKNAIVDGLNKGEEISIKNFGRFKVVETKLRRCVNPITKRIYLAKPKKVTVFKSYKNFKQCVK